MRMLFCLISSVLLSILCFLGLFYFSFFYNFLFKYITFYQLFENLKHLYYIVWLDLPLTLTSLSLEDSLLSIFSHVHDLFQFWFVSFKITRWMKIGLLTYLWMWGHPLKHTKPVRGLAISSQTPEILSVLPIFSIWWMPIWVDSLCCRLMVINTINILNSSRRKASDCSRRSLYLSFAFRGPLRIFRHSQLSVFPWGSLLEFKHSSVEMTTT